MKTRILKIAVVTSITVLSQAVQVTAQNAGNLLKAGEGNANKLINAYLSSTLDGIGQGINDGWNNTAKPLELFGLDLRLNAGLGIVPTKDQTFDFNSIAMRSTDAKTYMVIQEGTNQNRPTIYGANEPNAARVYVRSNIGGMDTALTSFTLPTGSGYSYSPSLPMLQMSVGLLKNTEVTLRYFPKTTIAQNYSLGLFGMAIKHDIMQWIPRFKNLMRDAKRPFDCSVFFGFTNFFAEYRKTLLAVDPLAYNPNPSFAYDNQSITFNGNTWTAGIIASKEFRPFKPNITFTPYLGVNYSYSFVKFQFEGDYPIPVVNDQYSAVHPQVAKIERVTNPVSLESEVSTARINAGARIKIYTFTISGEYSIGKINTVTIGLGLNLQSLK
ncbi:MAG: DUF6588 family protein, partial [Bacteroidia bacterium]